VEKILFIVNPISGSGNGKKFYDHFLKNLKKSYNIEIILTKERDHATKICLEMCCKYSKIIICGGDGTFNEAINGIPSDSECAIGLIPIGSGNDFMKNFIQTTDYNFYLDSLSKNTFMTHKVDIGEIEINHCHSPEVVKRKFINSCGIGFDAYVAYLNQNSKKIKGKLSYIYSIIMGLVKSKAIQFTGFFDSLPKEGNKLFISIGNGKTAGGGLFLTPYAEVKDGLLDFTLVDNISMFKLIRKLPLAIKNKLHLLHEVEFGTFKSASLKLENPYFVHVDGESISNCASEIKISICEHKLNFITL